MSMQLQDSHYGSSEVRADPYDLNSLLFHWSRWDAFTLSMAMESILVTGETGGGKTSGAGATILKALLRAEGRFGGLVCCAKPDEAEHIINLCRQCGREEDVIRFAADQPWRFNFLDYEVRRQGRGGGLTENIVALLQTIVELVEGKIGQSKGDEFWNRASQMLIRNSVELLILAQGSLSLQEICDFVSSAPRSIDVIGDEAWRNDSFCAQIISRAEEKVRTGPAETKHDFDVAAAFWLRSWPEMGDRTRASIEATFLSFADMLLHGVAYKLFCTSTNLVPEVCWRDGKIIILDLPTQEYETVGAICQGIFKNCWQKSILQRNVKEYPRPCFLYMDECQNFISSFDWKYFAVSRSARVCNVSMTQNLHNLIAKLGGSSAQSEVYSLLGNMVTKVAHANNDATTNNWMADIIAQDWQVSTTYNTGLNGRHTNAGGSQTLAHKVLPGEMAKLAKGGPANNFLVEAIVTQGGRKFRANGNQTWIKCVFNQKDG
jgi:hypothetical protein